jgi:hypothetical protein
MRNIDSVLVKKAIIHVLDRNADTPILTDFEQEIDEDIHEFLEKHIVKSLTDEENKKAKFKDGMTVVKNACQTIFQDESKFIEASHIIAQHMFKAMKNNNQISSADLVVCLYSSQEENYIGILKMDYKKSFIHNVEFIDDQLRISILPQAIGLPGLGQKLQKCAFIKPFDEGDDFDLILLDKQSYGKDDDSEIAFFFANNFLCCDILMDSRDKTRTFKNLTEKWTRKNLKENFDKAQEVREEMITTLKNSAEIDIEKFTQNVFGNDMDMQQNFVQQFHKEGIPIDSFDIDKNWVEKKMKKRVMKTDTGMEIRAEYDDFEDRMKFEMKRNGDGTVDLVIKNVRSFQER